MFVLDRAILSVIYYLPINIIIWKSIEFNLTCIRPYTTTLKWNICSLQKLSKNFKKQQDREEKRKNEVHLSMEVKDKQTKNYQKRFSFLDQINCWNNELFCDNLFFQWGFNNFSSFSPFPFLLSELICNRIPWNKKRSKTKMFLSLNLLCYARLSNFN